MRNESHKTWIATVLDHVNLWRKRSGWSRESVVQAIVEAHERTGGPANTGIRFEPHTTDAFERQKVNADRIFRWLDDATKDTNLLPSNFIPSVLAAMPMDVRLHCLDDLLRSLGIAARPVGGLEANDLNAVANLRNIMAQNSEAQQAVAALVDGATTDELLKAQRELAESRDATVTALAAVEEALVTHRDVGASS